VYETEDLPVK